MRLIEIDPISTLKNFPVVETTSLCVATNLVYADRGSKRGRVNIVATKVVVRDGGKGVKVAN